MIKSWSSFFKIIFSTFLLLFFASLFLTSSISPLVSSVSNILQPANSRKLPIYSVDAKDAKISLSFDAAWGNEDTAEILDILKRHQIKATFFMTGQWIEKYPDDVKQIAAAGHDLANHSAHHYEMSTLSHSECINEIKTVHEQINNLCQQQMNLFRPPYGDYNNTLIDAAHELNYHVIQWSVDSLDWKDYGKDHIVKTILNHKYLNNGAIILMHNGAKYTKDALEDVITGLKDKGFSFVPISELIYHEKYDIDHTGKQFLKE